MTSRIGALALRTDTAAQDGLVRVAVASGYTAHARLCAQARKRLGYIPRVTSIPSPYAYSLVDLVWSYKGRPVIIREVSHMRYEAYALPATMPIYKSEKAVREASL